MSAKRPLRCAIYTRKSTEEGLDQEFNSLDAQREACEAYVASQKAEGWIALRNRYDDGGYSGGTLERPALRRLLGEIENGSVDVVVVYKIDRLSRSLMDFTRLVELFDRKSVTFVSVTQSFNTTTSMGRLTLNVLLSFAQFEREVTGERIRDKFAASKKKGIWMGGNPPLGYDVSDRKLIVNPAEAETVRLIFQRYLDLGCARLLADDLVPRGVVSKRRTFGDGRPRGGKPLGRSALYCILNNRTYVGETTHKGASYTGEHDAIVPRELFDAVQHRLAELGRPLFGKVRASQDAPFAGRLFDETGASMRPTYSVKRGGIRYRYYASAPTLKGQRSTAAISRIPAPPFEAYLTSVIRRLDLPGVETDDEAKATVDRIEILADSIAVRLHRDAALAVRRQLASDSSKRRDRDLVDEQRSHLIDGEAIADDGAHLIVSLPVLARFRGGRATVRYPAGFAQQPVQPDIAMIKALARGHRWRQMLMDGEAASIEEIARRFDLDRGHVGLTLNLGFLSPALTRAIVQGAQPADLRLTDLLAADIPLSWESQRETFRESQRSR